MNHIGDNLPAYEVEAITTRLAELKGSRRRDDTLALLAALPIIKAPWETEFPPAAQESLGRWAHPMVMRYVTRRFRRELIELRSLYQSSPYGCRIAKYLHVIASASSDKGERATALAAIRALTF